MLRSAKRTGLLHCNAPDPVSLVAAGSFNQADYFCIFTEGFFAPTKVAWQSTRLPFKLVVIRCSKSAEGRKQRDRSYSSGKCARSSPPVAPMKYDLLRSLCCWSWSIMEDSFSLRRVLTIHSHTGLGARASSLFIDCWSSSFLLNLPHRTTPTLQGGKRLCRPDWLRSFVVNLLFKVLKENTRQDVPAELIMCLGRSCGKQRSF